MSYLFNEDKTKLEMGAALLVKNTGSLNVQVNGLSTQLYSIDLDNDELINLGYKPLAVAGYGTLKAGLVLARCEIESESNILYISVGNATNSMLNCMLHFTILWVKQ